MKNKWAVISIALVACLCLLASCKHECSSTCNHDHQHYHDEHIDETSKEYSSAYVCPMHCEGSGSSEMGTCPVCQMDYVKKKKKKRSKCNHPHHNH